MRSKSTAIVTVAIITAVFCIFMAQCSPPPEEEEQQTEATSPTEEEQQAEATSQTEEERQAEAASPTEEEQQTEVTSQTEEEQQAEATSPPSEITNSIGMQLRLIPAGSFMMGTSPGDSEADDDESPRHQVEITRPFYIGVYEVTQAQWKEVMGTDVIQQRDNWYSDIGLVGPTYGEGSSYPIYYVNWDETKEFCRRLSQKEGATYRLPTEAEWEYVCRAGTTTRFYWSDSESMLYSYANYADRSCGKEASYPWIDSSYDDGYSETSPAGSLKPNGWGLYDMSGNVWEWCEDLYDEEYYSNSPIKDPPGPTSGHIHVLRGGSWDSPASSLRSSARLKPIPRNLINNTYGLRVVRDVN